MTDQLTERQQRERDYHREYAAKKRDLVNEEVSLDVTINKNRRWWNAYWATYDILRNAGVQGKRVLVPGCGFGGDAIRLASMGAEVHAFDLSPEAVDICRARAERFGYDSVQFDVMPSETMSYDNDFFDFVLFLDILHHVDIPRTVAECVRVLKPGGRFIGDELYTHSLPERIFRKSAFVEKIVYPRMVKYIYGSGTPYITEDEHKIDENEFAHICAVMSECRILYFNMFIGRLIPDRHVNLSKVDRVLMKCLGGSGQFVAGRIVFDGVVR